MTEVLHLFMAAENSNAGDFYNGNTTNILNSLIEESELNQPTFSNLNNN